MKTCQRLSFGLPQWLLASLVLICSAVAFAAETTEDFIGRRQTIPDIPRECGPIGKAPVVARAKSALGVILQASATFEVDGRKLSPKEVRLVWHRAGGPGELRPALKHGGKVTVLEGFNEEDTLRLAAWVARSESTIALSLLPEEHEDRPALVKVGLVKTDKTIQLPEFQIDGEVAIREIKAPAALLVHPVLDTTALVGALGYIDFADGSVGGPRTRAVVVDPENEQALIDGMNEHVQPEGTFFIFGRSNYTNTDVDSLFTVNLSNAGRRGEPFRYYWRMYDNGSIHFHAVKRFKATEEVQQDYPDRLRTQHRRTIEIFRHAAVFRAFREEAPGQLIDFINEAIDRRKAK